VAQGVVVSGDTVSKGVEFELVANPAAGWQISMNASKTDAVRNNIGAAYKEWMEKRHADFEGPMGDIRIWGGGNSALDPATSNTIRSKFENEPWAGYKLATALEGSSVPELRAWRFNVVTNYDFQEGALKGANIGGSYRWIDKNVTGFPINSTGDGYDVTRPYTGSSEDYVDLWAGYSFRVFNDKVNWRIQLNVRNVFGGDSLIPVTVQPDGTPAAYKIAEPRTFTLTNTFQF
jgi:outer membrane receptor for ferric coprogen and ferric-rhodotorulic acid